MITMDQLRPLDAEITLRIAVGDAVIPLEFVCHVCRREDKNFPCKACGNKGVVPSPQGRAILALLKNHAGG